MERLKNRPEKINKILEEFKKKAIKQYGDHIKKIILYGSYARGDFQEDSDIDIMVLVDFPKDEICNHDSGLSDIGFDLSFDNDFIEISIIMQNIDFFEKWVVSYPFYKNVANDGVELYAA